MQIQSDPNYISMKTFCFAIGWKPRYSDVSTMRIKLASFTLGSVLIAIPMITTFGKELPQPSPSFSAPHELEKSDKAISFGKHLVTRAVDWNGDEYIDLLLSGGDGRVWISIGKSQPSPISPIRVSAGASEIRLGDSNTCACFADLNGDGLSDLIVAHSDQKLAFFPNTGKDGQPVFKVLTELSHDNGNQVVLEKGAGARIDVGDLDGDGDLDLVAGHFSGPIQFFENIGTKQSPKFSQPIPIEVDGSVKNYSYNVHPTIFDVNGDGHNDIVYGMNWGTIHYLIAKPSKESNDNHLPDFVESAPSQVPGGAIDLREIAGDDATPTFADFDRDGTLDILTGGRNEKALLLRGVPIQEQFKRLTEIMVKHSNDLGAKLKDDADLRNELIGLHQGIYRLCSNFLTSPEARQDLKKWYVDHIRENGEWLQHRFHDPKAEPYVCSIAYQTWTTLMLMHEGDPDSREHREFVADVIGFKGRLKDILVEYGTFVIENGKGTPNQLETIWSYLGLIPKPLLGDRSISAITEVITIAEYFEPRLDVLNAGGVNIFASESGVIGSSENPFPKDFPSVKNDYFGLVLAHELNHRVDYTRFAAVPKYNEHYWAHMRKISGPDIKFNAANGIGVDWTETKRNFQEKKLWNGEEKEWNNAWANYWLTGLGKDRRLNVCRNETTYNPPRFGIPFFLETRQESIASLANQYFTDTEQMLQFALERYEKGSPGCLDEWLLMVDVYSMDGPTSFLYRHPNGSVTLERTEMPIGRDPRGFVNAVTIRGKKYQFELDANGLVDKVSQ